MAACPAGRPTLGRGRVSDFCFACCSRTCRGSVRPTLSTLQSDAVRLACHVHGVRPYVVGGRVMACRVVGLPRRPGGCLSCVLLTGVPWVDRGLTRTSVSFLDVAPPPLPPAHTTHTGGRPCRVGQAGWGAPMVTCTVSLLYPLCRSGKPWGGSFPRYPSGTLGFLFFFQKSCPFWTIRFFLANEIASCSFHHWTPALAR